MDEKRGMNFFRRIQLSTDLFKTWTSGPSHLPTPEDTWYHKRANLTESIYPNPINSKTLKPTFPSLEPNMTQTHQHKRPPPNPPNPPKSTHTHT